MTGVDTVSPAIVHACHLVHTSNRGEDASSDAIDRLLRSGRTSDAIRSDGWRLASGYPADRDEAEQRLNNSLLIGVLSCMPTVECRGTNP